MPEPAAQPAPAAPAPTYFNNQAVTLLSRTNLFCIKEIPEAGSYTLYVKGHGPGARSSFRMKINDQLTDVDFGNTADNTLKAGGTFNLPKGPIKILVTRINEGCTFDVAFLSKNDKLTEAELPALEYGGREVKVLADLNTGRGTPKFGDINGDGKMDVLSVGAGGAVGVFLNDGKKVWDWAAQGNLTLGSGYEPPGLIWDLDQDGKGEVIHWRAQDGKEKLVVADGMTGAVKHIVDWPTPAAPHEYYNFRLAIANLDGGYPDQVVVYTDAGNEFKSVAAYGPTLTKLWEHNENLKKDHLGHYVYPMDVTGDGIDEIFLSALSLDAKGKKIWDRFDVFFDNHDHADSFRFADLTGDGVPELLCPWSDVGIVVVDARTGKIVWQHPAAHSQQVEFGNFLEGHPGPQLAVNARFYQGVTSGGLSADVRWFDPRGSLISVWPSRQLSGNPDFCKGDWYGNGTEVLFWHKFRMKPDGTGDLYFADTGIHMFDFDGNGTDDVITTGGGGVKVYSWSGAPATGKRKITDPNKLRWSVTNLTHY